MYRETELGLLVRLDPREAAAQVLEAYRECEGNAVQAARVLGVAHTTLLRWLEQLERRGVAVRDAIAAIREQAAA